MREVAERAGVSVTTVSHIINDTRPVRDELRRRVTVAMSELGYQPNALARSLRRKQTRTLGLIVPDSANPFFAEVARGIEDTSFEHGYTVILCNSDGNLAEELLYINVLVEKQVDGILFVAAGASAEHIRALLTRGMPLVVVDREVPGVVIDRVFTDNTRGGRLAAQHLLELGHRRIGCITGPPGVSLSADRINGFWQILAENDIPIDEKLIVKGDFQYEGGYQAARFLLALEYPPTAIFACNDLMAIGATSAALEWGWQVPADLSVIGFDDVRLASFTNPSLTTIAQPKHDMGVLAATMLLDRIHQPHLPPRRRLLETKLIVRQSTAPIGHQHL